FKVVIEANDIAQKVDARLADVGKDIRLPGFRPGKVPMKILKQRFGGSVLGEVLDQTIRESSTSLFEERGLRPAGQPKIEVTSFDEGKDLEFDVSIEVLPEIETMDLSTIEIEKLTVETGDEEVDAALQRIAEQNKTSEPITGKRMSKKGDVVVIDFVGSIDGTPFDGGKADDYPLELGSNSESKDVEVSFPEDYGAEDLAGKNAVFACSVKEIREQKLPEIDDAFASNLGLENLDALKDAIREQIGGEYAQVARDAMKRKLLDILAEAHEFELPEGMLDSEFEGIWQQVEKARENDQLDEDDKARSEDELREQYRNIALRRVRLGLLLSDIGEKNGLTVSQEEVNRAIMQQARQMPGQEQQVIEYFRGSPDAQRSLQAPIFEDKVVDFIVEMAKVTERTVSVEELTAAATGDDGEGKSAKPKAKSGGRKKKAASAKKNKEEAGDDAAAEADEV
ncbi:MAG: trigger factor, partial [Alphaproteobacteria bacterium]